MRVKVSFRYRADTGDVEVFQVEDMQTESRSPDHDARHDRAAGDVARIVEANAFIEETLPAGHALPAREAPGRRAGPAPAEQVPREQRDRQREQGASG